MPVLGLENPLASPLTPYTNWWKFLRWSDGSTNNPCMVTIGFSNNNYIAVFTNLVPLNLLITKGW